MGSRRVTVFAAGALLLTGAAGAAPYPISPLITATPQNGVGYSAYRMALANDGSYALATMPPAGDRLLRNGQPIVITTAQGGFSSTSVSNTGHTVSVVTLPGTYPPEAVNNPNTVLFDQTPVVRPGTPTTTPAFPTGTYWISINDAVVNDRNEVFVTGVVKPPASFALATITKYTVDDLGRVLTEQTIFKNDDRLPDGAGSGFAVNVPRHHWEWEANNAGQVLATHSVSADILYRDQTQLVRRGGPSPVAGQTYGLFFAAHLNNNGNWATAVGLGTGTSPALVVADGRAVVRVGDALANGYALTGIRDQVFVADDGAVFWAGTWNDPNTAKNFGIFRDGELVVQMGVSTSDGVVVSDIDRFGSGGVFTVSDDGTKLAFHGTLASGANGLYLVAVPEPGTLAWAVALLSLLGGRRRR